MSFRGPVAAATIRAMEQTLPPGPTLSVSIVLHNSSPVLLGRTLASLERAVAAAQPGLARVTVALVDNASTTASGAAVQRLLARRGADSRLQLDWRRLPENRGFGAGHNSVLQSLDSDLHLVLNPDVELDRDMLAAGIAELAANPDIALLSPRATGSRGGQEFLCKRYPSVLALLLRGFAPGSVRRRCDALLAHYEARDLCAGEGPADVPIASGCCMLARSAALRAAGGFDERYFLYFEDFDLSLRLREYGRVVFSPALRIVHHGGYAARKGPRHWYFFCRAGCLFFQRHGWRWLQVAGRSC